jgi:hypothetical protein
MDMSFVAVAAAASHMATGRWLLRVIVAVNGDAHSAAQAAIVAEKELRRSIGILWIEIVFTGRP